MSKNPFNEREIRLECLKLAATVTAQLKQPNASVVAVAKQYLNFLKEGDLEEEETPARRAMSRAA